MLVSFLYTSPSAMHAYLVLEKNLDAEVVPSTIAPIMGDEG